MGAAWKERRKGKIKKQTEDKKEPKGAIRRLNHLVNT